MFSIKSANIAATDGGCLDLNQNLPVTGFRHRKLFDFHPALAGQKHTFHKILL
jgi:hypothetical protein